MAVFTNLQDRNRFVEARNAAGSSAEIRCGALMSDWKHFKLGFYHLFGRHATELPEKILPRKKLETEENGWTLWSFNRANLEVWHCVLSNTDPPSLFVFCGPWKKASDPGGRKRYCTCFRYVGPNE